MGRLGGLRRELVSLSVVTGAAAYVHCTISGTVCLQRHWRPKLGKSIGCCLTLLTLSGTTSTDVFIGTTVGGVHNGVINFNSTGSKVIFFTATGTTTYIGANVKTSSGYMTSTTSPSARSTPSPCLSRWMGLSRVTPTPRPAGIWTPTTPSCKTSALATSPSRKKPQA